MLLTRISFALPAALAALESSVAAAEPGECDPTIPHRVAIGPPAGVWPMYRGDGARSGRARTPFPTSLVVERRVHLRADLTGGPVVDDRGRFVAATKDGKLLELSETGDEIYSLQLEAPAVLGPIIESNGTRVLVTREAVAMGITSGGTVAFATPLVGSPPAAARGSALAEPLATRDGAAVFALGALVTKLGPDGDVRATAELDEPVAALTETPRAVYLSTDTGRVLEWSPPARPRPVGTLGGKPTSEVVAASAEHLVAVVRSSSVVDLTLRDGARATLLTILPDVVVDTPALTPNGELRLLTRAGALLGYAGSRETLRRSVTPQTTVPTFASGEGPPPLVDPSGAVAYVTAAAGIGIVHASGETEASSVGECGPPVAFVPVGPHRLALACRSGVLAFIGEPPSRAAR